MESIVLYIITKQTTRDKDFFFISEYFNTTESLFYQHDSSFRRDVNARHAKAKKFKRGLSENQEPIRSTISCFVVRILVTLCENPQ